MHVLPSAQRFLVTDVSRSSDELFLVDDWGMFDIMGVVEKLLDYVYQHPNPTVEASNPAPVSICKYFNFIPIIYVQF